MKKDKSYTNYRKNYRSLRDDSKPQNEEAATEIQEEHIEEKPIEEVKTESETHQAIDEKDAHGVVANCTSVNVRYDPSPTGTVIDIVPVGTKVSIVLEKSTNDYYYVTYCDPTKVVTGYILKDYVVRGLSYER